MLVAVKMQFVSSGTEIAVTKEDVGNEIERLLYVVSYFITLKMVGGRKNVFNK